MISKFNQTNWNQRETIYQLGIATTLNSNPQSHWLNSTKKKKKNFLVKVISLSWTTFVIFLLEHSFLFITKTYKHYKYQDKEECTIEGKCEVTSYRLNQIDITIL